MENTERWYYIESTGEDLLDGFAIVNFEGFVICGYIRSEYETQSIVADHNNNLIAGKQKATYLAEKREYSDMFALRLTV